MGTQTTESIVEGLSQQLTTDQIKVREGKIIKDEDGLVERDSVNSVNKLLHQARTNGSIKLRVVFGTEFTTRDARKHAENTQRYEGIRQSIISDLGPRLIKEDRSNFPGHPWIFVTVDAVGLQQLINDPRVIYIESVDLSDLSDEEFRELLDKAYSSDLILSPSEVLMSAIGRKQTSGFCSTTVIVGDYKLPPLRQILNFSSESSRNTRGVSASSNGYCGYRF